MRAKELTKYLLAAIVIFGISAVSPHALAQHNGSEGNKEHTENYIIISKEDLTLTLYDERGVVVVQYPVAVGKNYGNKQHMGDYRTPEGEFYVQQIQEASKWRHDFGDGLGVIENCYGNWFIRLYTPPYKGIGIQGTHLPELIGTRSTEGCIRLRNEDLDALRPYIELGMKVIIEPSQADLPADDEITALPEVEDKADESEAAEQSDSVATATPLPSAAEKDVATDNDTGSEELWHTVEDGDLVSKIAYKYGTSSQEIQRLNPTINIDRIDIGQRIKVRGTPPEPQIAKPHIATQQREEMQTQQNTEAERVASEELWHTIEDGDYLGKIAIRYNTTVRKIEALNPGMNVDKIRAGERIRVK